MKKRSVCGILLALLLSIFMMIPVAAEGKMNVAVLCLTDDAKSSTEKMEKILGKNKLSRWRLNKMVTYYSDNAKRPTNITEVNKILDMAFAGSTSQDINYLFIASHGYSGTDEKNQVRHLYTGLILDKNNIQAGLYRYIELADKLTDYKGQFVVILDACYAENFYTTGLEYFSNHLGRFSVFCSAQKNSVAYGFANSQTYTGKIVKSLTYQTKKKCYKADTNADGFITLEELYKSVGWGLSSYRTYGNLKSQLFQFGYVKLSKKSLTVNLADQSTYKLKLKKYNCTRNQKPCWKSSNTSVATVDKNGKVTFHNGGTVTITAYLADKSGKMCLGSESSCTIQVVKPTIKLNKSSMTLYKKQTAKLTATVTGTKKKVSWKSSNSSAVSVKKGKLTAKKAGTVTVTAKVGKISAKCVVTVKNPTVSLNKTSLTLAKNGTANLVATVKGASQKVTWKSSNKNTVAVSSTGRISAKKAGTAIVTAMANGVKATCRVTVSSAPISVKLSKNSITMNSNTTTTLKATVTGTAQTPTWSSSNTSVVTVSKNGVVSAKKDGTAVITVSVGDKKATCKVKVKTYKELLQYFGKDIYSVRSEYKTYYGSVPNKVSYTKRSQSYYLRPEIVSGPVFEAYNGTEVNKISIHNVMKNYCLNGIYEYMSQEDASALLEKNGWKLISEQFKKELVKKYRHSIFVLDYIYERGNYLCGFREYNGIVKKVMYTEMTTNAIKSFFTI